jgi:glutamate--cysteine ligase
MRVNNETFYAISMRKALEHKRFFDRKEPSQETIAKYTALAKKSFADQADIENSDELSFDDFLTHYYNQ